MARPIREEALERGAGCPPAFELPGDVPPALVGDGAGRVKRTEGGTHLALDDRRFRVRGVEVDCRRVERFERLGPGERDDDRRDTDLRAVEGEGPDRLLGVHVQQVAHDVLGPRDRRRLAGDAEGHPGERHQPRQQGERRRLVGPDRIGGRKKRLALATEQGDRCRVPVRVHPKRAGEVPVCGRREHRGELTKSGPVHLGRRVSDDLQVDHERVGPTRGDGPLDTVVNEDGHVVREGVHGNRRLDHDEGQVAGAMGSVLRDVGDRPRPDAHNTAGARDRGVGLGQRTLVRMKLRAALADDRPANFTRFGKPLDHEGLEVVGTAAHRRAVRQDDHRPGETQRQDERGDVVKGVLADPDRSHPDGVQAPGRIGIPQESVDGVEVSRVG